MEHIAALMLIVSCSGSVDNCKELPSPVTVFETMEECREILPQALKAFEGKGQLYSTCVTVDPAMMEEDAVLTWDIGKDGVLHASVDVGEMTVASNTRRENVVVVPQ